MNREQVEANHQLRNNPVRYTQESKSNYIIIYILGQSIGKSSITPASERDDKGRQRDHRGKNLSTHLEILN